MAFFKSRVRWFCLLSVFVSVYGHSSELPGKWQGNLSIGQQLVPIIFNVSGNGGQFSATMDSPLQGAKDIPVKSVEVSGEQVIFDISVAGARYESTLTDATLSGTWIQSGQRFELVMTKGEVQAPVKTVNRPQEPKAPVPYHVENVTFTNNTHGVKLAGTLTLPDDPKAAVVLVSGSGPQDRDQLSMGHKTFWVLADYLSRNGIAVLRYDDRGVGESLGVFEGATSYDFAHDASAAIDFLKQHHALNQLSIGIIGHSEGGLIAPIVADMNRNTGFIALLAAPSQNGRFVSENQIYRILLSNGLTARAAKLGSAITTQLNEIILANPAMPVAQLRGALLAAYAEQWKSLPNEVKAQLKKLGGGSLPEPRLKTLTGDWYKAFLTHNPVSYLAKLEIPVFALYAENDVQVSAKEHADLMHETLLKTGNTLSKTLVLPGHNHMFQESETGAMSEYQHIEQTLSPALLNHVNSWILSALSFQRN